MIEFIVYWRLTRPVYSTYKSRRCNLPQSHASSVCHPSTRNDLQTHPPPLFLIQKLDLLPRIRRRNEPQTLQRSQRALLARLVHNLPVPQREYGDSGKVHPLARIGLVQRPDGEVAESNAGMRAAADPAADDVRPARDERMLVRVERDVWKGLCRDAYQCDGPV